MSTGYISAIADNNECKSITDLTSGVYALATPHTPHSDSLIESVRLLDITEQRMMDFAVKNNIDYTDDILLESFARLGDSVDFLNEGVVGDTYTKLKNLSHRFAGFIVAIWKRIVNNIRTLISRLKQWFIGPEKKEKVYQPLSKPIEVSLIDITSTDATTKTFMVHSEQELGKHAIYINEHIATTINHLTAQQIRLIDEQDHIIDKNIKETMNEATILKGRTINSPEKEATMSDALFGRETTSALTHSDLESSNMHMSIEEYDKIKMHEMIDSKDIIAEYNAYIDLRIDQLKKMEERDNDGIGPISSYMRELVDAGVSENNIRSYIKDTLFNIPSDPEVLRKIIHLRLNYNKKIISLLSKIMTSNYHIIGITKEESEEMLKKLNQGDTSAITKLKQGVSDNIDKFKHSSGYIDLRSIGAGVLFVTKEDLGKGVKLERFVERNMQLSLRYDAIVLAHGESDHNISNTTMIKVHDTDKDRHDILDKQKKQIAKFNELKKLSDTHYHEYEKNKELRDHFVEEIASIKDPTERTVYQSKIDKYKERMSASGKQYNSIQESMIELDKEMDASEEEIKIAMKKHDESKNEASRENKNFRDMTWVCQPINTLHAGPFHRIDDLIRQLYREGFRRIFIYSCNPGHHQLPEDIRNLKGVTIRMSDHSVLIESVTLGYPKGDPLNEVLSLVKTRLYHGADQEYTKLEPLAHDLGNILQPPGWSLFCWKDENSAVSWAVFKTLLHIIRASGNRGADYITWDPSKATGILSDDAIKVLKKHLPVTAYVYSFEIDRHKVGVGNDTNHDEYTVRDSVIPDRKKEIQLTEKNIKSAITTLSRADFDKYEVKSGDRDLLHKLIIDTTVIHNVDAMRALKKGLKTGEIVPGDDIETYLASKDVKINKLSPLQRILPVDVSKLNESAVVYPDGMITELLNESVIGLGSAVDGRFGLQANQSMVHPTLIGSFLRDNGAELKSIMVPFMRSKDNELNAKLGINETEPNCKISENTITVDGGKIKSIDLVTTRDINPGENIILRDEDQLHPLVVMYIQNKAKELIDFKETFLGRAKNDTDPLSESSLLKTGDDISYNFDKWVNNEDDILFIHGYSGSGKSTVAKKLAKDYDATYIELDVVSREYKKKFGDDVWSKTRNGKFVSDTYIAYLNKAASKGRIVVDGAQLAYIDFNYVSEHPVYIKNTSFVESTYRAIKRQWEPGHIERYGERKQVAVYLSGNFKLYPKLADFIKCMDKKFTGIIMDGEPLNESVGLNEAATSNTLRSNIENDIYQLLDAMDISGANSALYRKRFATMPDKEFFEMMDRLFEDEDFNLVIQYKPFDNHLTYEFLESVARKFDIVVCDYMVQPYLTGKDDDDTPVTVHKIHFGIVKERRLHQTIREKTGTSTSIDHRNTETGQVIGEDKHARVSDVDLYSLIGQNQLMAATEFHNERSSDMSRKQAMYADIRQTGEYSMNSGDNSMLNKTALLTMYYYTLASGLKNNLMEDTGLILPSTMKSRDIADKVE